MTRPASAIRVVYGPPGAGKTTYIQQHRAPHDVVIDLDAIAEAMGSPTSHAHPTPIYEAAQAARSAAIRRILDHQVPAWIIDTKLSTESIRRRAFLCDFILVDPGLDETRRRATAAGRPASSIRYIEEWYNNPPELPPQTQFGNTPAQRNTQRRTNDRKRIARARANCGICGQPIDYSLKWPDPWCFVVDHIVPIKLGGPDTIANKQAVHNTCNSKKRARLVAPIVKRSSSLNW